MECTPSCLKLVIIMLETLAQTNLAHKYTHIWNFRKFTFQYQGTLKFAHTNIFFAKHQRFLAKIVLWLKVIMWELCRSFFSSVFCFYKIKGYYWWKYKFCRLCFRNPSSELLQIGYKLEKRQWHHNFLPWRIVNLFWRCVVSLVKFSYWSTFHVDIITSSGVMTISFYKGLPRNPETGNIPVWVLPNIWRLGWVKTNKFGTNVSNKILLNSIKCQDYNFDRFWVIKWKPIGGRV